MPALPEEFFLNSNRPNFKEFRSLDLSMSNPSRRTGTFALLCKIPFTLSRLDTRFLYFKRFFLLNSTRQTLMTYRKDTEKGQVTVQEFAAHTRRFGILCSNISFLLAQSVGFISFPSTSSTAVYFNFLLQKYCYPARRFFCGSTRRGFGGTSRPLWKGNFWFSI